MGMYKGNTVHVKSPEFKLRIPKSKTVNKTKQKVIPNGKVLFGVLHSL